MVAPSRTPLAGLMEVDETEYPFRTRDDPPAGGRGRSRQGKSSSSAPSRSKAEPRKAAARPYPPCANRRLLGEHA
jgi:hypothetical protein